MTTLASVAPAEAGNRPKGATMAYAGQTLKNPASGERITFRRTAAETDGELVAIDLELPTGARVPGGLHHESDFRQRRFVHQAARRQVADSDADVVDNSAHLPFNPLFTGVVGIDEP
jgi:hypothetical protein